MTQSPGSRADTSAMAADATPLAARESCVGAAASISYGCGGPTLLSTVLSLQYISLS